MRRTRQPWLTKTNWTLLGIAAAALLAWMVVIAVRFIRDSAKDLTALGSAGEFFNFVYGVPIAAIGALFGILTTIVAYQVANKQGDIQLLEFAVDKSQIALRLYRRLTGALGDTLFAAGKVEELGRGLVGRISRDIDQNSSATVEMLLALDAINFDADELAEFVNGIRNPDLRGVAIESILVLVNFKIAISSVTEILTEITDDIFASHFAKQQILSFRPADRPLDYLRAVLPPALIRSNAGNFSSNVRDLSMNMMVLASRTVATEIPLAYERIPNRFRIVELIGHVLLSVELKRRDFHIHRGLRIGGYRVNLGAAYLLTVFQLVPELETIADSFEAIFETRSPAAMKFLRSAFPDRGELGLSDIMESLKYSLDNLNRLITVEIYDSDGSRYEFYDPAVHGPIPVGGYELFDDEEV